ncbi:MAG: porin family protein [Micropepsaceae bacterium]
MKAVLLCTVLAAALTGAASAQGTYVEVFGGVALPGDLTFDYPTGSDNTFDTNSGYSYGAALGFDIGSGWSVEGEVAYYKSEYTGYDPNNNDLLNLSVNGYYTFNTGGQFKPYLGVGIGYGDVGYEGDVDQSNWGFTYQGMAGIRMALSDKIEFFGEYRYVASEDVDLDTVIYKAEYHAHNIQAGLRFNF